MKKLILAAAVVLTPAAYAQQGPVEIIDEPAQQEPVPTGTVTSTIDIDSMIERLNRRMKEDARTISIAIYDMEDMGKIMGQRLEKRIKKDVKTLQQLIKDAASAIAPAAHAQQGPVEVSDETAKQDSKGAKSTTKPIDVDAMGKRLDKRLTKDAKTVKKFFGIDPEKRDQGEPSGEKPIPEDFKDAPDE